MYLYTTVQVISHVFVYYCSSDQSCICVLRVSPLPLPMIFLMDFELFPTVWYFAIIFWTISDSMVFFYYILNYFRQYGILLLDFELFPTVWYFSIRFWTISDSVVFFYYILNYFRQCGIFLLYFELFPTVWYFAIRFWTISDSMVFCY